MNAQGSGAVAQLGERLVRNEEVSGSIPLGSTIFRKPPRYSAGISGRFGLYVRLVLMRQPLIQKAVQPGP